MSVDNDDQLMDIDEARIRLSLKNDEINNLRASIKTSQIRSSLKVADFQYKINQLENKIASGESKYLKQEDVFKKQRVSYQEEINKLQVEVGRLKKVIDENQSLSKQKEREYKGAIYEQNMKIEKEKENNYRLISEIELLHKYFQPKKIMVLLKKQKLDEVLTYSQLYSRYVNSQQNLQYANKQINSIRSQTMSEIETSVNALSTIESVMYELKIKNDELQQEMVQKELQLQSHIQTKGLLEAVQQETSTEIQQLNAQLIILRRQVQFYQSDEAKYKKQDESYAEQIEMLQMKLQKKQMQCELHLTEYQQKLVILEQQNKVLRSELQQLQLQLKENQQSSNNMVVGLQLQIENKCNVIGLLNESLKDREEMIVELQRENQHMVYEINSLLRAKRKMSEDFRYNEDMLKTKFQILNEEIENMKCKIDVTNQNEVKMVRGQHQSGSNGSNSERNGKILKRVMSGQSAFKGAMSPYPQNLLLDLNDRVNLEDAISNADLGNYEQDPSWPEKYLSLLQKHNEFARKVFARLRTLSTRK